MIAPANMARALDDDAPATILRSHGADADDIPALLQYTQNNFAPGVHAERLIGASDEALLDDEPFVAAWDEYASCAERVGAWSCLCARLVQLRFPIREGISRSENYLAATRRGVHAPVGSQLELKAPDGVRLVLHRTAAGRIPVIIADEREDFVTIVQALTHRNEPEPIPASLGATMVAGYNNWDRIAQLRRAWEAGEIYQSHPDWSSVFRAITPRKELYQDRFILLSTGPYSAVPAEQMHMSAREWAETSLTIRLEHECAHYFTRRVLGSMKNLLHDELLADYCGITAAAGRFRADWLLTFLGLENFPDYRAGGRLENYRGTPQLSDSAFRVLQSLMVSAAKSVEWWDAETFGDAPRTKMQRAIALLELAALPIEAIAEGMQSAMCRPKNLMLAAASRR